MPQANEEGTMSESSYEAMQEMRCEEACALEWVQCVEDEDGAAICKTRERNCLSDCS